MYSRCSDMAKNAGLTELFNAVFGLMQKLHEEKGICLKLCARRAWAATCCLASVSGDGKYAFLSMAPGSGKTYVVLLLMLFLELQKLFVRFPKRSGLPKTR